MSDVKMLQGDCREVLKTLPDESVHCVITSPPYWGLRDYGVEGQLGLEKSPEEYVCHLVEVFREVKRVLRDDGTLWLNLGDSYATQPAGNKTWGNGVGSNKHYEGEHIHSTTKRDFGSGLKSKDLVGIPWMVAFALRADGWYLRSDIIWSKPNPMPESVTDRPTKAHEYVFLLSKSASYYYDAEAIAEPLQASSIKRNQSGWHGNEQRDYVNGPQNHMSKYLGSEQAKAETHRNKRSVWTIPTSPYKEAHFATFPPKLIEPMILAGTSARGVCTNCGAQWERVVERTQLSERDDTGRTHSLESHRNGKSAPPEKGWESESKTLGWQPTCSHQGEPIPPTILDPFAGSGTVGQVAIKHQRNAILIDLNPIYLTLQEKRTNGVQVAMPIGVV